MDLGLTSGVGAEDIDATTMSTMKKTKKPEPETNHRKFKLPPGAVLLAKPSNARNDFKCVRCAHEWEARKQNELPVRCPGCSSPSWNKARMIARRGGAYGPECHCVKCGWDWTAIKSEGIPATCPRCRNYDWQEKTGLPSAKPAGVK